MIPRIYYFKKCYFKSNFLIYHELSFIEQVSPLMYTDNLWLYYQFSKLQITNYIKVVGVCLPAAKEQKFIIILFIIKLSFFTYSAPYEKSDGP